jgi:hypothetical protein
MRRSGKRSALCARSNTSEEGIGEGAADQVVDADSSLVMTTTRARMTIKPLLRYGKVWFIALTMPLRINMAKSPHVDKPHINDRTEARKFG